MTIGAVDEALVDRIREFFRVQYGLDIYRGPPLSVPLPMANAARRSLDLDDLQIDGDDMTDFVAYPHAGANFDASGLVVIGLMPLDIYTESVPEWLYEFGESFKGTPPRTSGGLISYYRMDDRVYGYRGNDERIVERIEKLMSKYVGMYYFDLPVSSDPRSAMYNLIRSNRDLDRMGDRLPVVR